MIDQKYKPHPREFYGIEHKPIIVTPIPSNRKVGQSVAFIGKQLCFFEHDGPQPEVGVPIEVMITRPLYARKLYQSTPGSTHSSIESDPQYIIDRCKLTAVLIRPVDPIEHILVAIDGFECSGTMCTTKANGVITHGRSAWTSAEVWPTIRKDRVRRSKSESDGEPVRLSLTPGRSQVRVADNVNAGSTWKQPFDPLYPTNVYVEKSIFEEKSGWCVRVAGLTRPEDCDYYNLFRK